MKLKLLLALATFSLVCRIIFSIYFSIKIVDENSLVNRYQVNLYALSTHHQLLENEHAGLTSLKYLFHQASLQKLQTVNTFLDLSL